MTSGAETFHLTGLAGLGADRLRELLTAAREMGKSPPERSLEGRVVALMFFEDSTRTRASFSIAAKKLGSDVFELAGKGSSASKGETLADTARTIEAMGVDAIVVRVSESGAPRGMAQHVDCPIISAGDGRHAHPTQGLLDLLTFAEAHGRADTFDLSGLTLAIVGDLNSSRVFRSDVAGFSQLGAEVIAVGPPSMAPGSLEAIGCRVERDLDAALEQADGVQMLRVQFERGAGTSMASVREYRAGYALTLERARRMKPGSVVMHPGPMNRGIELDHDVAEGPTEREPDLPRPIILEQVAAGVRVRMAVLQDLVMRSDARR
ncbi:MAG: aspartate carbamoyltransferase catalytic subunit [Planctomycetota bacterium]